MKLRLSLAFVLMLAVAAGIAGQSAPAPAVPAALPSARVFGSDISARPVALARRNARALGLSNVTFVRGDLFRPLPRRVQYSRAR